MKIHFGIKYARKLAFEYTERNEFKHSCPKEKKQPGKDCLYGFLKSHHNLKLHKPQEINLNKDPVFSKEEVQ